jgi:two-component system OmpR family sensor kinase
VASTKGAPWYSPLLSLRWRLAVVYSALFGIFVILLSVFLYSSTSNLLLHNAQAAFPQRARALRTLLTEEVCSTTSSLSLKGFIQQNMTSDIDTIYLLDQNGKVIISSDESQARQSFPSVHPQLLNSALPDNGQTFQNNSSSGSAPNDGLILPLSAPQNCLAPHHLPGYMVLITSYTNEQSSLRTILLMLGITSLFMIIIGALIISFFTGIMFKPLQQVTRATRELAQGNLQQRVPLWQSHDEIAELAKSFNQMADRIEQMFVAQQASEHRARRFVSDASHELRTPITSLRGFTEVLIRGAKDDPTTTHHVLSLMKNEAERMTDLVNNLLTLARLDEGHVPASEDVDLVAVVVECLQQARKKTPADYKIALELATQERLQIQAHGEQLQQLLLVLLDNAVKYGCTGEQKKVVLLLDKQTQRARIQVIDYGVGITPADLPHIFDRFYRGENAHSSTSTPIPGTGLGLSIAMAIAQAYQGTLTVCSEPHQETVFTVSFLCTQ